MNSTHSDQQRTTADISEVTAEHCESCKTVLRVQVCRSNAGYYLGMICATCGPHSRFSGYANTRDEAENVLNAFLNNPCRLAPYFLCVEGLPSVRWLAYEDPSGAIHRRGYIPLATSNAVGTVSVR